jgi:hypothetical protein
MDKEAAKRRLHELVSGNADRVRIIRSEREIEALNMTEVVAGGTLNIFDNYDEAMFDFISKCLAEGKEVAIQAAGPRKLIVHAAHGLWRVRPGSPTPPERNPTNLDRAKKGRLLRCHRRLWRSVCARSDCAFCFPR